MTIRWSLKHARIAEAGTAVLAAVLTVVWAYGWAAHWWTRQSFDGLAEQLALVAGPETDQPPTAPPAPEPDQNAKPADPKPEQPDKSEPSEPDPHAQRLAAAAKLLDEQVQRITQRNMFGAPAKGFSAKLTGVLGDRAIFNGGKTARVGEKISDATVLEIGPDWVEVDFKGQKIKQWVFGAGSPSPPPGPQPQPPAHPTAPQPPHAEEGSTPPSSGPGSAPAPTTHPAATQPHPDKRGSTP